MRLSEKKNKVVNVMKIENQNLDKMISFLFLQEQQIVAQHFSDNLIFD